MRNKQVKGPKLKVEKGISPHRGGGGRPNPHLDRAIQVIEGLPLECSIFVSADDQSEYGLHYHNIRTRLNKLQIIHQYTFRQVKDAAGKSLGYRVFRIR